MTIENAVKVLKGLPENDILAMHLNELYTDKNAFIEENIEGSYYIVNGKMYHYTNTVGNVLGKLEGVIHGCR